MSQSRFLMPTIYPPAVKSYLTTLCENTLAQDGTTLTSSSLMLGLSTEHDFHGTSSGSRLHSEFAIRLLIVSGNE